MLKSLPLSAIQADPGQPRKIFDDTKLEELAASIKEHGLLQPITVRAKNQDSFLIVMGERRFRAHKLAKLKTIKAHVVDLDERLAAEQTIIENLQRDNLTPLEEARAYHKMMDQYGLSVKELAGRLGIKQHWRITDRTALLNLEYEYQQLLSAKQISASQATELSRLGTRGQNTLFKAIKNGECKDYASLRAVSSALVEVEAQAALFTETETPAVAAEDVKLATNFERKIEQVALLLNTGIKNNEIVAAQKVNPTNAATLADKMAAMQSSLRSIEMSLRQASAQAEFSKPGCHC